MIAIVIKILESFKEGVWLVFEGSICIVALATCSLAGDRLWLRDGSDDDLTISRVDLLQRAIDLCHLLQFEFIYKPVCSLS